MSKAKKETKANWLPVTLKVPPEIAAHLRTILQRKPHYTQQAILIDAIYAGLPRVDSEEKARA